MKKYSKKQTIQLIGNIAVLLLGFLPWATINGKGYGVLGMITASASGEIGQSGLADPFSVWSICTILTYIINIILLVKILRRKPYAGMLRVSAYFALSVTILLYAVLKVITLARSYSMGLEFWIPIRTAIALILVAVDSAAEDDNVAAYRTEARARAEAEARQERRRAPSWWLRVLMTIAFIVDFTAADWIRYDRDYKIMEIIRAVRQAASPARFFGASGSGKVSAEITNLVAAYWCQYLIPAIVLLLIARLVLIALKRKTRILDLIIYSIAFLYICIFMMFPSFDFCLGLPLGMVFIASDAFFGKYFDERADMKARAARIRALRKAVKEEKQRREAFPGHYDRAFYHVVLKNFRSNIRDYGMFLVGAGATMATLVGIGGMEESLGGFRVVGAEFYQKEILQMMRQILPVVIFLGVLMLALIITSYIRTRMKNYSVYSALGIRARTLTMIITIEYLTCVLGAMLLGTIVGLIMLRSLDMTAHLGKVFLMAAGFYLLIVLLATLVNYHLFEYKNIMRLTASEENERIPKTALPFGAILGLIAVAFGFRQFSIPGQSESFFAAGFVLIGAYLIIFFGGALWIRKRLDSAKTDGSLLLRLLPWRYRFRTNVRFLFLLFAMQFLALGIFLPKFAAIRSADAVSGLYPYDTVAVVYDDDMQKINDAVQTNSVDASAYKMLRLTTPLGEAIPWLETNYASVLWPQGQHVAISESTYKELCKAAGVSPEKLDLSDSLSRKGRKAHVVIQQDISANAHALEWFSGGGGNLFRLGQPVEYYRYALRHLIYPRHEVTYERKILTGMLRGGVQENLVVFNDDYFNEVLALPDTTGKTYPEAAPNTTHEGPTNLILIKSKKGQQRTAIRRTLRQIEKTHEADRRFDSLIRTYYRTDVIARHVEEGRVFNQVLYLLVTAGLLLMSLFTFCIRYGLGAGEQRKQYKLLDTLGMHQKDQHRLFDRTARTFIWGSGLAAVITSGIYTAILLHIRMATAAETAAFLKVWGIAAGASFLLTMLILEGLRAYFRKLTGPQTGYIVSEDKRTKHER